MARRIHGDLSKDRIPVVEPRTRERIAFLVCAPPCRETAAKMIPATIEGDPEKQGGRCFICGQENADTQAVEFVL